MNVLQISTADNSGGAAKGAYRLHRGLQQLGVMSRFFVKWKTTSDPNVRPIAESLSARIADRLASFICDAIGFQYFFFPSNLKLFWDAWVREADIIQMQNIHGNFFSLFFLIFLSRRKPVVWYLHDMWALTGHCIFPSDCDEWKRGCKGCACSLTDYPPLKWNTTAFLWKVKSWIYARSNLTLITTCEWMRQTVKQSPLLGCFDCRIIPCGIDVSIFKATDKAQARRHFGLDPHRTYILFGSLYRDDPRKGADLINPIIMNLPEDLRRSLTLLTIGKNTGKDAAAPEGVDIKHLGFIQGDDIMALAYSAADIFALPTRADTLPSTLIESMACGTPVVAFDVGGVSSAVRHMETGYVVKPQDTVDFARGLQTLLTDKTLYEKMQLKGRAMVETEYGQELFVKQVYNLYSELIKD